MTELSHYERSLHWDLFHLKSLITYVYQDRAMEILWKRTIYGVAADWVLLIAGIGIVVANVFILAFVTLKEKSQEALVRLPKTTIIKEIASNNGWWPFFGNLRKCGVKAEQSTATWHSALVTRIALWLQVGNDGWRKHAVKRMQNWRMPFNDIDQWPSHFTKTLNIRWDE